MCCRKKPTLHAATAIDHSNHTPHALEGLGIYLALRVLLGYTSSTAAPTTSGDPPQRTLLPPSMFLLFEKAYPSLPLMAQACFSMSPPRFISPNHSICAVSATLIAICPSSYNFFGLEVIFGRLECYYCLIDLVRYCRLFYVKSFSSRIDSRPRSKLYPHDSAPLLEAISVWIRCLTDAAYLNSARRTRVL